MSDLLGKQYVTPVLVRLYEGQVKMTELSDIVSNYSTLRLLIRYLQDEDYVVVREVFEDKRKILVSLTEKGKRVAEQLKRADEAAKGVTIFEEEGRIEIKSPPEEWEKNWENLHALFHVNVYEDHVTIMETSGEKGRERIFNIYIRKNGQGRLRLWCEEDESFDCYHVGYALTLAPVQEMFVRIRGGK
jgi:DNA-binding MarR family transcriptional regulator